MLCKIINEITNTPNKGILKSADTRTRRKHGNIFHIMTKNSNNTYSFFPYTISQWSDLPEALVDSDTVHICL